MQGSEIYLGRDRFVGDESFYINRAHEPVRERCISHTHDFMEICYVAEGKGFHMLCGKQYRVFKGDLFIINFDEAHAFYKESANDRLVTCNIVFKPDFLDYSLIGCDGFKTLLVSYLFKNIDATRMVKEDLRLDADAQKEFDLLIGSMYREYSLRQDGFMSILRAYLIELIVKIIRCLNQSVQTQGRADSPVIDKVLEYLQENYAKRLNLEELSLQCFLSKNYFCRLFKNATGMTMSNYIQMLRIDEACRLLDKTDQKIDDIALETGFTDAKNFRLAFSQIKGMTPSEYRKREKNGAF